MMVFSTPFWSIHLSCILFLLFPFNYYFSFLLFDRGMIVKTHNRQKIFYRHFKPFAFFFQIAFNLTSFDLKLRFINIHAIVDVRSIFWKNFPYLFSLLENDFPFNLFHLWKFEFRPKKTIFQLNFICFQI